VGLILSDRFDRAQKHTTPIAAGENIKPDTPTAGTSQIPARIR